MRIHLITIVLLMAACCVQGYAKTNPCGTDKMYGNPPSIADLKLMEQIDQRFKDLKIWPVKDPIMNF